jgi:hypothetical protein
MIVGMRTRGQAAKIAAATGGTPLAGKPKRDGTPTLSRYVDVGADFEVHRAAVESVSVLFDLFDGDADCYARTGSPGAPLPTGWAVTAAKFEVDWPAEPQRAGLVRSHFGARRKAFNWGLARVKADLDAKSVDPGHESVGWDLGSLRWAWNRAKHTAAPWWAENSKEAYSSGLADLARALENWSASKNGKRKGPTPQPGLRPAAVALQAAQNDGLPRGREPSPGSLASSSAMASPYGLAWRRGICVGHHRCSTISSARRERPLSRWTRICAGNPGPLKPSRLRVPDHQQIVGSRSSRG